MKVPRRFLTSLAILLAVAVANRAHADEIDDALADPLAKEEVCREYGTSVVFASSPAAAARQALKEEKLLLVLHVSGLFEDSDFT